MEELALLLTLLDGLRLIELLGLSEELGLVELDGLTEDDGDSEALAELEGDCEGLGEVEELGETEALGLSEELGEAIAPAKRATTDEPAEIGFQIQTKRIRPEVTAAVPTVTVMSRLIARAGKLVSVLAIKVA